MVTRVCSSCGRVVDRFRVCPVCGKARRKKQVSSSKRGYGASHKKLRERLALRVASGMVACARCGGLIAPGEPWDLGHDDHDRSRYVGAEHARCNRATAGRAPVVRSRIW